MFVPAFLVALLAWPACVLSLSIELTPKQRNVTQGEVTEFHYKPKDQVPTNVTVIDTLTNNTYQVVDNALGGQVNWTVPETLEVRGGYFYVATRRVNNATLIVTSDAEFQVLEKPKPKPSKAPEHNSADTTSPPLAALGSMSLVGLALFVL